MRKPIDNALSEAKIYILPKDEKYKDENRKWQGIASFVKTKNGTMYAVWYSGGSTEMAGNFAIVARSDDGEKFLCPYLVVEHPHMTVRVFDPNLWFDPLGRLWLTWNQSWDTFDGRAGVWAAICDDPDESELSFSKPFRIFDGVMMNKPTALKNGNWLFPCAIWQKSNINMPNAITPRDENNVTYSKYLPGAYAVLSDDCGKSFKVLGYTEYRPADYEEHMFLELSDGSIKMYIRCKEGIAESTSYDGGKTFDLAALSKLGGPCARFFIRRLSSGAILLVNHQNESLKAPQFANTEMKGRANLTAMLSHDEGKTWQGFLLLDERENISYPDGMEEENGLIHIIYDRGRYNDREILLSTFTEKDILAGTPIDGKARLKQLINVAKG